jgi:hypothetical protein
MTYILSARGLLDFALPLMKAVAADALAGRVLEGTERAFIAEVSRQFGSNPDSR